MKFKFPSVNSKASLCVLLVTLSLGSFALGIEQASKRVLFLGNSVFYSRGGLMISFEGFCRSAGQDFQAFSQWHEPANPHGVEFLNYGRIPLNLPGVAAEEDLHRLIRSGGFDFVILEARRSGYLLPDWVGLPPSRGESIPYEENLAALEKLHRTIVESGARTVLYMHPDLSTTADIKHAVAQIYHRLHRDLEAMSVNGQKKEVILVPALYLWQDAVQRYGVEGWYFDEGHGNALARYASACLLYTYLTGLDPRQNEFSQLTELTRDWKTIPEKTDILAKEEEVAWIKQQAWLYFSTRP